MNESMFKNIFFLHLYYYFMETEVFQKQCYFLIKLHNLEKKLTNNLLSLNERIYFKLRVIII